MLNKDALVWMKFRRVHLVWSVSIINTNYSILRCRRRKQTFRFLQYFKLWKLVKIFPTNFVAILMVTDWSKPQSIKSWITLDRNIYLFLFGDIQINCTLCSWAHARGYNCNCVVTQMQIVAQNGISDWEIARKTIATFLKSQIFLCEFSINFFSSFYSEFKFTSNLEQLKK